MHDLNLTEEDQKIFMLLNSGEYANDLLGFEIIKKMGKVQPFLGALICLAATTVKESFRNEILSYIDPVLTEKQRTIVNGLRNSHINLRIDHPEFKRNDLINIFYTNARRTGIDSDKFLTLDDGTHPDRATVFKSWLVLRKVYHNISIPGLLPHEWDIYVREVFSKIPDSNNYNLIIFGLKTDNIPDVIFSRNYKQVMILAFTFRQKFPEFIFKIKGMESLSIELFPDYEIPKDWSRLADLTKVTFKGKDFVFEEFDFIDSLPKLKTLEIYNHFIKSPNVLLRKKAVPLQYIPPFKNRDGYGPKGRNHDAFPLSNSETLKMAKALGKSILTMEEKEYYFKKFTRLEYFSNLFFISNNKLMNLKDLNFISKNELMKLMNVNHAKLRDILQGKLEKLCKESYGASSLNEKSLLYIAGEPEKSKLEIKRKLKELNISLASKPTERITHLVICKDSKEYNEFDASELQLVSEQDLYQMFKADVPELIGEGERVDEKQINKIIQQFIYNDEIMNVSHGLKMLKNGGVPDDLVEPLLVVSKSCPSLKVREIAKELLLDNAPAELLPLINDSQLFTNLTGKIPPQDLSKKLQKIAETTSKDLAVKMALLFHGRFKKGLQYILNHFLRPCDERTLALKAMMEETHFDFASGMGYRDYSDIENPELIQFINLSKIRLPYRFPLDILQHAPLILSAKFHNCQLSSLPTDIGKMKDLKKLDLSYNFLSTIPESFEKLIYLEHLDLRMNRFEIFPFVLKRLPNLKFLDFRYNKTSHGFVPVEIDDDVKKALKNCKILV